MKKVICLGGGNNQISVIKSQASRLRLEVITVDRNNIAKGKKFSNYFINKSTGDPIKIFEELKEKKISDNIIGVLNRSSSYPVITNSVF